MLWENTLAIMSRLRGRSKKFCLYLVLCTTSLFIWFTLRARNYRNYQWYHEYEIGKDAQYAIETAGCNILEFNPSHPNIAKHSNNIFEKLVCSEKLPLTEVSGMSFILHVNRMAQYGSSKTKLDCFYQGISRINQSPQKYDLDSDSKWKLEKKIAIKNRVTIVEEDGILVTCTKAGETVYQNVHYFIKPLRAQEKRQTYKADGGDRDERPEKLSVVFMGTDSVSRGSLQRLMPKTYEYLTNHLHAIDLQGFNKVADNTHPNLLAILMGLSKPELQNHKCQSQQPKSKFDDCPFIWKDFADKGYVTIYGEDVPDMWAFHHNSPGFVEEPTTYYPRPYMQASEELIGHNGGSQVLERNVCQGPTMTMSVIHEYALSIAKTLRDIPYFGFFWTTSLTHDLLNAATLADEPSLEYLKSLHRGGYLEHTILFFISDHGLRFGAFRSTYAGMLEERLPYVTMVFPEWFKQEYPEAMRNMAINAKRLTSTFDLHATLQDIVNRAYVNPRQRSRRKHNGQSLFLEVPSNRTCNDAGIPEHFCACEHTTKANPNDPNLVNAAESTINELNRGLSAFPNCAQLSLDKVLTARLWSAPNNTAFGNHGNDSTSYVVVFVTKPGEAMLEATVRYQNAKYERAFDVSRINKFGNQSHCIEHPRYRSYCYCNDLLY